MTDRLVAGPAMVLLACAVASLCYVGAVTTVGLFLMVLPLTVIAGLAAWRLSDRPQNAVLGTVLVAGVGGEIVNVVSGQYQGSAARSAGVAAFLTGLAVVAAGTRRPALFLAPVVGIVAWALALGAGARVPLVAALTAAASALALATVERDARTFVRAPRLGIAVALGVLLVIGASLAALAFQRAHDDRVAASPFRHTLEKVIEPPALLSLTRHPPPSATKVVPPSDIPAPTRQVRTGHPVAKRVLDVLAALIVTLVVGVLGRLVWVAVAWRTFRRRLQRRAEPAEAGAWIWTTGVLARFARPLPPHLSPDLVLDDAGLQHLHGLARAVEQASFARSPRTPAPSAAWPAAREITSHTWQQASRRQRLHALWVFPQTVAASPRVTSMRARGTT